jgi:cytidylate kinase
MGSVVFPNAQLKVFIDAELSERARRRHHELAEQGLKLPISKVKENLQFRDRYDSSRRYSPLRIPDHAVRLDTTRLSIADEVAALVKLIRERLK